MSHLRNYVTVIGAAHTAMGTETICVDVMDGVVVSSATLVAFIIRAMRGC